MADKLNIPLVFATSASFISGEDYPAILLSLIEGARSRIWAFYFLIGITNDGDPCRPVKEIIDAMGRAAVRGVDVRLIADNYESEDDGFNSNLISLEYLSRRNAAVKVFRSDQHKSTHSKDMLIDDNYQIAGSGNLTHGGLINNRESALLIESVELNRLLAQRFNKYWQTALPYVSILRKESS